jgi:hypothetical protein
MKEIRPRYLVMEVLCAGDNSQGDQASDDSGGSSKEFEIIDDKESS